MLGDVAVDRGEEGVGGGLANGGGLGAVAPDAGGRSEDGGGVTQFLQDADGGLEGLVRPPARGAEADDLAAAGDSAILGRGPALQHERDSGAAGDEPLLF